MARIDAPTGSTVEETKRTRVLPASEAEKGDSLTFWEYQDQIKPDDLASHIIYVYRWLDDGVAVFVAKRVPPVDEPLLQKEYGGGAYRLMMKRGPQIMKTITRVCVEGPPKPAVAEPQPHSANGGSNLDRLCDLLEKVILKENGQGTVNEAMRGALTLQAEGFRSVQNEIRNLQPPAAAPSAGPMDDIVKQFMQAAVGKMMNPANPIEEFAKMATAMKALIPEAAGNNGSMGVEIVRQLGGALPQVMEGIKQYLVIMDRQLQLQITQMQMHGGMPPQPGAAAQAAQHAAQPAAAPQPAQQIPQTQQPAQEPQVITIDDIDRRIAAFFTDPKLTPKEAAELCLDFLKEISPAQLYPYVCSLDEANLLAFLNSRPILSQIPQNPRFSEVVKKICELTAPEPADPQNTPPTSA